MAHPVVTPEDVKKLDKPTTGERGCCAPRRRHSRRRTAVEHLPRADVLFAYIWLVCNIEPHSQ